MVNPGQIIQVNIEDEMRDSYLDYSMSVIIGRAIPDIRDGLKPVHRRILYAMFQEGLLSSKRYSKCAGVVGEVLKKYHPHGDMAVYDALVRMAQEWNIRYPMIDGQGNFGSIDGDPPAAYRYTEARLTKLAEEMLADIEKETVDFIPNFDNSIEEPTVLTAKIPNLLINGSDGIAVGMATKIPPHNLGEVVDGIQALIKNPDLTIRDLMKCVPGPDFPTGGFIYGRDGIKSAYETGRGIVQLRARAMIEPVARGDKENIVITEIPFQINKARLIEKIAELVNEGRLEGIADIRDESDKDGMRIVLELKRNAVSGVLLNQLYKHTAMHSTFGVIMLAIVGGRPRVLNLKEALQLFVDHRKEVILRRTAYDLRKAEERAHILEGLKIALDHIDEIIALIKKSKSPPDAKLILMGKFKLSDPQAQAILEMRLQRLTALEQEKILEELQELQGLIKRYKEILKSEKLVLEIISSELAEMKEKYADPRRTEIQSQTEDLSVEDLIAEEDMVVTVSHSGYIKRNPISVYRAQRRGGRGKIGMETRDEDFISDLFIASTHSYVLVFSSRGKVYWLKVHEIPQAGRTAKGKPIVSMVPFENNEELAAVLPVRSFEEGKAVIFATRKGIVKKTDLMAYSNPRTSGIIALTIDEGDALIAAQLTQKGDDIFLGTKTGLALRFNEDEARTMGRTATGVIGIRMDKDDSLIGMEVVREGATILTVTENGFGKRTDTAEYRIQGRGGKGIITIKTTEKNGSVVGVRQVTDADHVMIISTKGKIIRLPIKQISVIGRNTQGVRLISLEPGEKVVAFETLAENEDDEKE